MAQINKPDTYFNTVLYTGNGSTQSITGVGFQPDLIWSKGRSLAGFDHSVTDSVRGNTKRIFPSIVDAEATCTVAVTSFDSDGFSLGDDNCATLANLNNYNGQTYVNWLWKANGAGSSNTDGSITSTVSANTTSGFSIVSYTGTGSTATIGHGLGVTPKMIITKNRSITETWRVYHTALGAGQALALNDVNATDTDAAYWSNTAPTSTVFTVGTTAGTNGSGNSMIAYCFSEVKGFSKIGSYTGNGSTDGTFVYTGFKPAFIITKPTANISSWNMTDVKRSTYNDGSLERLKSNTSDAETSTLNFDILSNGFKLRTTDNDYNPSGLNVIYMAFAENPLVGTNNIPATAR